jgi:hypothetical protein
MILFLRAYSISALQYAFQLHLKVKPHPQEPTSNLRRNKGQMSEVAKLLR